MGPELVSCTWENCFVFRVVFERFCEFRHIPSKLSNLAMEWSTWTKSGIQALHLLIVTCHLTCAVGCTLVLNKLQWCTLHCRLCSLPMSLCWCSNSWGDYKVCNILWISAYSPYSSYPIFCSALSKQTLNTLKVIGDFCFSLLIPW